jgi:hypothetical protein
MRNVDDLYCAAEVSGGRSGLQPRGRHPPRRRGKEIVDLFDGSHSAKRVFNHLIIDDSIRFWAGCPEACVDLFVSWLSMDRWQQD